MSGVSSKVTSDTAWREFASDKSRCAAFHLTDLWRCHSRTDRSPFKADGATVFRVRTDKCHIARVQLGHFHPIKAPPGRAPRPRSEQSQVLPVSCSLPVLNISSRRDHTLSPYTVTAFFHFACSQGSSKVPRPSPCVAESQSEALSMNTFNLFRHWLMDVSASGPSQ